MVAVAFVAPYLLETTARFVEAAARLPGVELGLITTEPFERVPSRLRQHAAAHWRVDDALDPGQIAAAVRGLSAQAGKVERLIGVLEQLQVSLAQVREELGLPGIGVATALRFRDKAHMKTVLAAAGVPCARHRLADSAAAAQSFVGDVGFPVVVKPPAGAGAKSTFRLDDVEDLRVWLDSAPPTPAEPALMEEFLTGDEGSFDSVTVGGRLVWHSVSHYLPTPLEVLRNPWIQWAVLMPRDISGPEYATLYATASAALAALDLDSGLTHMEWFRRPDDSIAVSEVAVRPPGGGISEMLNYAHDMDIYTAWARLMVFGDFDPPERRWSVGAVFPRGQGSGRVHAVHGLDRLQAEIGSLVVEARLPERGQLSSSSYEGDGYIAVRHPETAIVVDAVRRLVTGIHVELESE
jgi:formate-dependent phosphoribosylglycinamide formyltransferase (GAR transformylase)